LGDINYGIIYNKTIGVFVYADYNISVVKPTGVQKEAIINLSRAANVLGLKIDLQQQNARLIHEFLKWKIRSLQGCEQQDIVNLF
jgi:hypothetical protein